MDPIYLITSIIIIIISVLIYYYFYLERTSHRLAEECRTIRHVKYVSQPSVLRIFWSKIRPELLQYDNIKRHGKVYGFHFFGTMNIVCAVPELIQTILSKEFTKFPNRRKITLGDPLIDNVLSMVQLEQWKRLRAIVSQTFATGKLRKMKPKMDSICATLVQNLNNHLDRSGDKLANFKQYAGAFTMDTIIQVAFGAKVDSLIEPDNPIIKHAKQMFSTDFSLKNMLIAFGIYILPKPIRDLFGIRFNAKVIDFFRDFGTEIIERKRKEFIGNDYAKATSFIEFLLEAEHQYNLQQEKLKSSSTLSSNGNDFKDANNNDSGGENKPVKYMSNDEMLSQCILFFLAGYDTTATLITMACYYLALNPDKQQLAYQEVCRVIEELPKTEDNKNELESIPFDYYSLTDTKLEYINGVVNESLRLCPPAAFVERRCMQECDLATEDGQWKIHVKKDDIMVIPVWSLHYNEEYFPEPESFKPERFCRDHPELNGFPKYGFLPFGAGPRVCVAKSLALLEGKMALVWLIKNFRFEKCDRTNLEFYFQSGILSPKDIWLKVQKRDKCK